MPASSLALDRSTCDRARLARDARFDGRFFTGVLTTRIYCRPTCPVKPARSRNVVFFPTAAAAEGAGFRPCLRCRPETAPGTPAWRGAASTVSRALRFIERGFLDEGKTVADLADALGMTPRHLHRLFARHAGASPTAVATTRRVQRAKALVDGTALDVGDRLRRRLRQHPALQRRLPRGVSPPAVGAPASTAAGAHVTDRRRLSQEMARPARAAAISRARAAPRSANWRQSPA